MKTATAFTQLIGCDVPIQQAGMGGASTPELAAAVSNAGGLGMLTASADDLSADVDATLRAAAGRPFGVNFLMPFFDRALLDAVAPRVRLVEWFWSQPDHVLVEVAHAAGALAAWQVGSADEALAAADAGCDLIVVQGVEAGGHVRGTIGLLPLLDAVLDAVEVPVVAAGGIGTARGVAAVLAAGAAAARVGTRFVATLESGAHPSYKQALVDADASGTVITDTYSVWWPDAPHRVLRTAVEAARALDDEPVGDAGGAGEPFPIPRFAVRPPNRATRGRIDAMALYAGQSVGAVRAIQPAADVMRELAMGTGPGSGQTELDPVPNTREDAMTALIRKNFDNPEEVRSFERGSGRIELHSLDSGLVGRGTFEPGWQWSKHVGPIAGTATCQASHMGYVVSGRMKIVMDDGEEAELGPGDLMVSPPGHDAWVVGDEPCVVIDWQGVADYAKHA